MAHGNTHTMSHPSLAALSCDAKPLLSLSLGEITRNNTYSKKTDFQRSSAAQQANKNLHVEPSNLRADLSMYSRSCMSISSGSTRNAPRLVRASFPLEKYLLPSGLMPSGCGGTDEPRRESSWESWGCAPLPSSSKAQLRVCRWCEGSCISTC